LLFLKALKFEIFEVDITIKEIITALVFAWFDDPFPVASVVLTNCVPQITLVLSANVVAVLIPAGARTINLFPLIALHEEAVPVTISARMILMYDIVNSVELMAILTRSTVVAPITNSVLNTTSPIVTVSKNPSLRLKVSCISSSVY